MIRRFMRVVLPIAIVSGAATIWITRHHSTLIAAKIDPNNQLKVITAVNQNFTNVPASSLQPAAAPERSATKPSLSPQKALPNYCLIGEIPYIDGCLPQP